MRWPLVAMGWVRLYALAAHVALASAASLAFALPAKAPAVRAVVWLDPAPPRIRLPRDGY